MAADRIADLTIDEFRQLVRETVREALEEFRRKADGQDFDWEAAAEAVMERFDEAWRRLADL